MIHRYDDKGRMKISWYVKRSANYLISFVRMARHSKTFSGDLSRTHFVTASDVSHEESLFQLLESIKKNRPGSQVSVIDLGVSDTAKSRLSSMGDVKVIRFPFEAHADWFRLGNQSGSYAWKSHSINLAIGQDLEAKSRSRVIWLDAGCTITNRRFILETLTDSQGFFANLSSGSIGQWTHPTSVETVCKRLRVESSQFLLNSTQVSAAAMGFNLEEAWVRELLNEWVDLSSDKKAISPSGASKSNHRFDQALISILIAQKYKNEWKPQSWPQIFLGFKIHQDID